MNTFHRSDEFDAWLAALKDKIGRARIVLRIRSAEHGNFGDCDQLARASLKCAFISALAIASISPVVVRCSIFLLGGNKSSQKRDIKRAIEMARALDKE